VNIQQKALSAFWRELSIFLNACDIFHLTAVNIEMKVLINLEFVEGDHLKLGESGVDEVLRLSS